MATHFKLQINHFPDKLGNPALCRVFRIAISFFLLLQAMQPLSMMQCKYLSVLYHALESITQIIMLTLTSIRAIIYDCTIPYTSIYKLILNTVQIFIIDYVYQDKNKL